VRRVPDNHLYYGDNLDVMRRHVRTDSVDLVYLDPPFNSQQAYNVLFEEKPGVASSAQIHGFEDTWHWDRAAPTYFAVVEAGGEVSQALQAFRKLLSDGDMLAYLSMMAPRLVELRRVLKSTGSLYLHCDPTASHYLKILLDAIFGVQNFRNEIVWKRFNFHADARRFGRVTDRILFYTCSDTFVFNRQRAAFSDEYVASKFTHVDEQGRRYRLSDLNPPAERGPVYEFHGVTKAWRFTEEKMRQLDAEGRIYTASQQAQLKRYLDELDGQAVHELWTDIPPINPMAQERLGYPTQKPEALLDRIIKTSSNEGDVVLDPFCGCGTAIAVAQKLKRRWIGIDITHIAITLIRSRLRHAFPTMAPGTYDVTGEPTTLNEAQKLAADDKFQFQLWALGLVGARPEQVKKGADQGVDGRLFFHLDDGETRQVVLSVKGGSTGPDHVRDLAGVVGRDNAEIGVLLTLEKPSPKMYEEAAGHGVYVSPWGRHPRVQILTIADLLSGKRIDMPPPSQVNITFKRAPKATSTRVEAQQAELMREEE
jgi:site-specific DNA-methyltransferase (adenine-specific)